MTTAPSECSELLGPPSAKRQRARVVREIQVATFSRQYQRPAVAVNLLVPELFFLFVAHSVYKM